MGGGKITQWIRLCLPFWSPRFNSQEQRIYFIQFLFELWYEKDENKEKEAGIDPFKN